MIHIFGGSGVVRHTRIGVKGWDGKLSIMLGATAHAYILTSMQVGILPTIIFFALILAVAGNMLVTSLHLLHAL